jgi:pimeloyl-ACP methyl ester carboxylesterase
MIFVRCSISKRARTMVRLANDRSAARGAASVVPRCRRLHASALILALTLVSLAPVAPARAASWLAPAGAAQEPRGPGEARGALVWSHGRSVDAEDYEAPTPPYIAILGEDGWDTFRFNRNRDGDTLEASSVALADAVQELKARGYRKVVLAGQSFGGFLSLMAARANAEVDAVVATAPAAYGSFADFYGSWRFNASRFYPLLRQVHETTGVMLFFFHGDGFDPGGRGERSRDILEARHLRGIVVDQPFALAGHWAAATPEFAGRFGECIQDFIDGAPAHAGACEDGLMVAGPPPEAERISLAPAAPREPAAVETASSQGGATPR